MLDAARIPPVASDELLARYVLSSSQIRSSNNTVKQDAFIPHPRHQLSLTRHLGATVEELWREGERVASIRQKTLYGRADVGVSAFIAEDLKVEASPIPENPNHVDAINWPADKAQQKMKATEIASKSQFVSKPPLIAIPGL